MPNSFSLRRIVFFYTGMSILAVGLARLTKTEIQFYRTDRIGMDGVWGIVIGLGIVGLSHQLNRHTTLFDDLLKVIHTHFGHLRTVGIFVIAFFSAVGEELLFRGFLQGAIGVLAANIIFGLVHIGPSVKFIPWTIFALVMGFLLGYITIISQSLVTPVVIHFVVNFGNLVTLPREFKT